MVKELAPQSPEGEYLRPKSQLRHAVYLGNTCPWCHRVALALALRQVPERLLDDPEKASRGGWAFDASEGFADPVFDAKDLREVYDRAAGGRGGAGGYVGRCTAPLLVDVQRRKAVSNDSEEIVRMVVTAQASSKELEQGRCIDLLPSQLQKEIEERRGTDGVDIWWPDFLIWRWHSLDEIAEMSDFIKKAIFIASRETNCLVHRLFTSLAEANQETNRWTYHLLSNAVYRAGFATSQDSINTLGGVVSALALSFVLGLQYMVAPGTDEMQFADFRSLASAVDGPGAVPPFGGAAAPRRGGRRGVAHPLHQRQGAPAPWGAVHVGRPWGGHPGAAPEDVQTAVAFTAAEFPMQYMRAFVTGDKYRWSKVTESVGGLTGALIFSSLLWSIILNISLALAPVREDSSGTALAAWLMIGGRR
eukprot:Skav209444  [mRNA]  locus=scaffold2199:69821:87658:- [translate_table: standard]